MFYLVTFHLLIHSVLFSCGWLYVKNTISVIFFEEKFGNCLLICSV